MKFKYYHGTSSFFLKSILKNGLGGLNPNIDFKNLDVLKYLKDLCENEILSNIGYQKIRDTTIAMSEQKFLEIINQFGDKQLLNFRHDGIYVALAMERAVTYATLNKFGSEILERCIVLYKLLKKEKIKFKIPSEINLFGIEKYLNYESKPIIIEINNIDDNDLEKEDGKTAIEGLNFLRDKIPQMSEEMKFKFLQICNFKILKPIGIEHLKIYELEYDGYPGEKNFEYSLSRIE